MPITSVDKDHENLHMTVVADFPVPVRRLWDAYVDPRQLEKFWGPVGWPATFIRHEVYPGGHSHYYMTGPDGQQYHAFWDFQSVEDGRAFEVADGFADQAGAPLDDMPTTRMVFQFEPMDEGSRVITSTHFGSLADMEKLLEMGMADGLQSAMTQIDDVVTDLASFAKDRATQAQHLSDTQVRVSRIIGGSVQQVWDAHHDPELLRRWLLGPEGWKFTDCQVATEVGQSYRYAWADANGENGFALIGELLETDPPYRTVTTENMEGFEGPATLNEQTLTPVAGGTLLCLVITYDSQQQRDAILATGMTDGMETSYARLESEILKTSDHDVAPKGTS